MIHEHISSWYTELSQDEEFLQELRQLFKDVTTEILSRLARVTIYVYICSQLMLARNIRM